MLHHYLLLFYNNVNEFCYYWKYGVNQRNLDPYGNLESNMNDNSGRLIIIYYSQGFYHLIIFLILN